MYNIYRTHNVVGSNPAHNLCCMSSLSLSLSHLSRPSLLCILFNEVEVPLEFSFEWLGRSSTSTLTYRHGFAMDLVGPAGVVAQGLDAAVQVDEEGLEERLPSVHCLHGLRDDNRQHQCTYQQPWVTPHIIYSQRY